MSMSKMMNRLLVGVTAIIAALIVLNLSGIAVLAQIGADFCS